MTKFNCLFILYISDIFGEDVSLRSQKAKKTIFKGSVVEGVSLLEDRASLVAQR